ncbi:MAG: hypothetical protein JST69_07880 [Bacteroidetes bacterium]|nr:hypothetical protein [Bacteroidota bacterium]
MRTVKFLFIIGCLVLLTACASSGTGYKPKYKKPNPNKPMPCPLKDC